MDEGEAIEHPWVSKAIENAQRKVEGRNFDVRKQLLEFDDVANDQRTHVYAQRREIMQADSIRDMILQIRDDVVIELVDRHLFLDGDGIIRSYLLTTRWHNFYLLYDGHIVSGTHKSHV